MKKFINSVINYLDTHKSVREALTQMPIVLVCVYALVVGTSLLQVSEGIETPRMWFWHNPMNWVVAFLIGMTFTFLDLYFEQRDQKKIEKIRTEFYNFVD